MAENESVLMLKTMVLGSHINVIHAATNNQDVLKIWDFVRHIL